MKYIHLDHVALHVDDVERSVAFYRNVLGLEEIPRPDFDFPGAWLRLGADQELHLIAGQDQSAQVRSGANHFALMVDDMNDTLRVLAERGATVTRRQTRPDGALQIYLADPDGHTIEICTAPPSHAERNNTQG